MSNVKNTKGLTRAFGAVETTLQTNSLDHTLRPHMARLHWEEIVGPQVASVTQVETVRGANGASGETILVVRVKNSVWANELTLLKNDILRRLNLKLGGKVLTDLHFKASGLAKAKKKPSASFIPPPAPQAEELAQITLEPASLAEIEKTISGITDDLLRERIRRTLLRVTRASIWKRAQGWQPCERCHTLMPPRVHGAALCDLCTLGIPSA